MQTSPKLLDFTSWPFDRRAAFVGEALTSLRARGFTRSRWPHACLVIRDGRVTATSRGDHAAWLSSNALESSARECIARTVPAGCVLAWIERDDAHGANVGFAIVALERETRALVAEQKVAS